MGYLCPFETDSLFFKNEIERFHLIGDKSSISSQNSSSVCTINY